MQAIVERLGRLETHRETMMEAGPFSRVALMIRDGDRDVMEAVYRRFRAGRAGDGGRGSPRQPSALSPSGVAFLLLMGFLRSLWRRPRHTPAEKHGPCAPSRSGFPASTT